MKPNPLRASYTRRGPDHHRTVESVQALTRLRFALPDEVPVMVSELACNRPGCPPLQTVVAFWTVDGERRHFKVLKSLTQVAPSDIQAVSLDDLVPGNDGSGATCC